MRSDGFDFRQQEFRAASKFFDRFAISFVIVLVIYNNGPSAVQDISPNCLCQVYAEAHSFGVRQRIDEAANPILPANALIRSTLRARDKSYALANGETSMLAISSAKSPALFTKQRVSISPAVLVIRMPSREGSRRSTFA